MNPLPTRALVIEDDRSWQQILSEILTDCGFDVDVAGSLEEATRLLKQQSHRLAVVDLSLSANDHNNYDGLRVLENVRRLDPSCRTILLTGFATVELAVKVLTDYNAFTFLRKESFHRAQFRDIIHRILTSAPPQVEAAPQAVSAPVKPEQRAEQPPNTPSETPQPAARVLVVDDDAGWRSIISELLIDCNFQVRPCASFGEALGYLRREKFSLAVVDLSLSGNVSGLWNGPANTQNLEGYQLLSNTRTNNIPTIVVSGVVSPEEIRRAYSEQSVFAYLEKQAFDRNTFRRIVEEARASRQVSGELSVLTDREREVLDLLSQGMTNKEIADKLVITTNTVKRHLKAVFEKLDVHTRSAAAAKAIGTRIENG